ADRRARGRRDRGDRSGGRSRPGIAVLSRRGALARARGASAPARRSRLLPRARGASAAAARGLPDGAVPDGRRAGHRPRAARVGDAHGLAGAEPARRRPRSGPRRGARPRPASANRFGGAALVNVWLWGATALLVGLVPCGWIALRETRVDALVAL